MAQQKPLLQADINLATSNQLVFSHQWGIYNTQLSFQALLNYNWPVLVERENKVAPIP
jgi:hypothetical protein